MRWAKLKEHAVKGNCTHYRSTPFRLLHS